MQCSGKGAPINKILFESNIFMCNFELNYACIKYKV